MTTRMPLAVFVSGGGTNLQAILDAAAKPDCAYTPVVVVSDRPQAPALDRARTAGVPAVALDPATTKRRAAMTTAACDAAAAHDAAAIALAGFMRILGPEAIARYPDRILNIHPSLLPAFPGAHAVEQALEAGVAWTGVTVHVVDEEVDHGPIVSQRPVRILPGDTPALLHERLRAVEHRLFPAVIDAMARGHFTVEGGRVRWEVSPHGVGPWGLTEEAS